MKYRVLVDGKMGFDDLTKIKEGDVFYEVDMGILMRGVACEDAQVEDNVVRYKAMVQDFYEDVLQEPREVDYQSTKGLMHYGGKFYREVRVWDLDEQEFSGKFEDIFNRK